MARGSSSRSSRRQDPRVSIAQAPREGLYPNWNQCVRRARGEYVYIATSDDGMAPDCLEKMVSALERHPECDAAHCKLVVVDENGAPLTNQWWLEGLFGRSLPDLVDRAHIRKAPYDGLLCLLGEQVYYSITELLFRRSLFARIGQFEADWGSVSDFNWYMRVGLVANIVHVPDTWATWRVHSKQATDFAVLRTSGHQQKVDQMIEAAAACLRAADGPRGRGGPACSLAGPDAGAANVLPRAWSSAGRRRSARVPARTDDRWLQRPFGGRRAPDGEAQVDGRGSRRDTAVARVARARSCRVA